MTASLVVLAGCTHNKPIPLPAQTVTPETNGQNLTGDTVNLEVQEAVPAGVTLVKAQNFQFQPREIRVKKGDKLVMRVQSVDGFHDLKIDALKVATKPLAPGQFEDITIPTDQAGTFEYYCSISNHRARGMIGQLIVE